MRVCKLTWRAPNSHGYGQLKRNGVQIGAHVAAWIDAHKRPVPKGKCVLHTCDVRLCIEPTHLFLGTKGDNNRDRAAKGRNGTGKGKLTKAQVRRVHRVYATRRKRGAIPALAVELNVTREALYYVASHPNWKGI